MFRFFTLMSAMACLILQCGRLEFMAEAKSKEPRLKNKSPDLRGRNDQATFPDPLPPNISGRLFSSTALRTVLTVIML